MGIETATTLILIGLIIFLVIRAIIKFWFKIIKIFILIVICITIYVLSSCTHTNNVSPIKENICQKQSY